MKMILNASFDTYTGYGNDAVDMAVQFERMGIDVVPWPDHISPGLPKAFTDLLTKDPKKDYDLTVKFAPPFDIRPEEFAHLGRTAVGWSMWERTPLLRADMFDHGWENPYDRPQWWSKPEGWESTPKLEKDWLDLMVVTCHDNVEAFQHLDPAMEYAVCPNGIDTNRFPEMDRSENKQFTFASVGMLAGRKDVFATLAAWKMAKEMDPEFDARLILKTATTGLHPQLMDIFPDLTIISDVWPQERLIAFYSQVDCLVSTSRGEGNNKPAMEFMSTGGPVMATEWSGHMNWLHPDSGYPLPGHLVEDPHTGASDFRVDISTTANTFLHVWRNQEEAKRKGVQAAKRIRAELSWEKVCERFIQHAVRAM
ncbi:glycosyltransferase [Arthrobacter phage Kitkat]|uniref:Glycosyltransferase n=2 Tax=Kelleziovirus kitkat TaxID=1982238 RepID=A0A140G6K6_9CAUD|nr:glycosyltransferase [Arthrobacter phage Kitkat]AMM44291.1 glycosyltransferase [Arthrobacter phage Kitkat]QGJ96467.1 glycosyltransferase [Arthrobacter phage BeatusComedenti]